MASLWWICRYGGYDGEPTSHISLSQRPDPKEETSHKPWSRCASVWIFLVDGGWNSFIWILSLINFFWYGLYFLFLLCFSFSFFFWHALWVCGIPSLGMHLFSLCFFYMPCGHVSYLLRVCIFYFFLYSPYIMMITLERDKHGTTWSFFCGWMDGWMDVRDLDHGHMKWFSQRVTTIWQSSMRRQVAYVERFFQTCNSWLWMGITYHWGTLFLFFCIFEKKNLRISSIT